MVIDDLADRPHACDLLLDQNLGRDAGDYDGLVPETCTRLVGPRYALLRPEFAAARPETLVGRTGRGLRHLLISMGGVDSGDATSAVLNALRDAPLPVDLRITVIMGSHAPALKRVRALARNMPRPTQVAVDVDDMAARMGAADLAIGAGGATTWERCALGLPSIILEIAANQAEISRAMVDAGAALTPGHLHADKFAARLRAAVAETADHPRLAVLSQNAAEICDGDGVGRVMRVLHPANVSLRSATPADSRRVWEWRRAVSKSARMASEDTLYHKHDAWFRRAVSDPDRSILIAEQGDLPCGYLRLDRTGVSQARVSICLSPEFSGKGLGRRLLEEADRLGRALGFEHLYAEIHPENQASGSVFEAASYIRGNLENGFIICHRALKEAT
jgi:spore coat polysaccharide biosynthesis predicted glycosyltransferase SpsG/RimJ/RimL family protein N-acetyltransferase